MTAEARQQAVRAAYDALSTGYDTTYADEVSRAEDRRLLRVLRPEVARAHRMLDVGCGTGWVYDNCEREMRDTSYRGFDLSEGMLKVFGEKHDLEADRLWQGDINGDWRDPVLRYDLVVSTYASPSYAEDTQEFLLQTRQRLVPGGRVVLVPHATGNTLRAPYLTDEPAAYLGDQPWYSHRARRELLAAGFTDVEITGMRHPLFGPDETKPAWAHDAWLKLEHRLFRADSMSFLVITATAR